MKGKEGANNSEVLKERGSMKNVKEEKKEGKSGRKESG